MTLIKSISGIRGTIGGRPAEGLTPIDITKFSAAYGSWIKNKNKNKKIKIVIGRDARISGKMVSNIIIGTLQGLGINVVDLGLSTTPTVEIAVEGENAQGGIIITASHNPKQWNALKLLNNKGEFIDDKEGKEVLKIAESGNFYFAEINNIGNYEFKNNWMEKHIDKILNLPIVNVEKIKSMGFKIAIDAVNSTGGIFVPYLLKKLGVKEITKIYCEPNGIFPHNPEPLPENITKISEKIIENKCDLGIVVDPDVDRLALVCEDGTIFGEEYTLVAVADYVLSKESGNTVSNLSSTKALEDITLKYNKKYYASAVGEVNVVKKMKEKKAVIGGEGNGGVIYPKLHYGRDSLVGIALFLTHLANKNCPVSELKKIYPYYYIAKNKMELKPTINIDELFYKIKEKYNNFKCDTTDGLKIIFEKQWVHLRKSNTEPIIRIYTESDNKKQATNLAKLIINDINKLV